MRYYVVADPHGFFTELKTTLEEKEFFTDDQPHKLIICGDLFDRGAEARELQAFILDLMEQGEVILIRGNHEDLLLDFLYSLPWSRHISPHHISNGTVDTVCQLTGTTEELLFASRFSVGKEMLDGPLVQRIIPAMVDYYETEHNIFAHGWIPCLRYQLSPYKAEYNPVPDWRNADEKMWSQARWTNGMEAAHSGVIECGKTIVCGHWHCSFGHANYEGKGSEFDQDADFAPYYADGIIALDACTALSKKVNCIIIDD